MPATDQAGRSRPSSRPRPAWSPLVRSPVVGAWCHATSMNAKQTPNQRPRELTPGEAAARLGMTPSALFRAVGAGRIVPAYRLPLGRGVPMFAPDDVDALIAARAAAAEGGK